MHRIFMTISSDNNGRFPCRDGFYRPRVAHGHNATVCRYPRHGIRGTPGWRILPLQLSGLPDMHAQPRCTDSFAPNRNSRNRNSGLRYINCRGDALSSNFPFNRELSNFCILILCNRIPNHPLIALCAITPSSFSDIPQIRRSTYACIYRICFY